MCLKKKAASTGTRKYFAAYALSEEEYCDRADTRYNSCRTPIPVPNSDNWTIPAAETIEVPQDMIGENRSSLRVKGSR